MVGNMERVVVTGMGVVSPLGNSVGEFWENLLSGRSGVRSLDNGPFAGMHTRIGAMVWDFDPSQHLEAKEARRMSRSSQFAVIATREAITDANLDDETVDPREVGILIG